MDIFHNDIVREKLMNEEGFTPYCQCKNRVTLIFDGDQFICPRCGWILELPEDFINEYKEKWNLEGPPEEIFTISSKYQTLDAKRKWNLLIVLHDWCEREMDKYREFV